MRFSRHQIGEELKNELQRGYNIERISNWALGMLREGRGEIEGEIDKVLNSICLMEAGPEFEYTEDELKKLSELLLIEEKDPIQIVDSMRFEQNRENELREHMKD